MTKTLLAALALAAVPSFALAMGCSKNHMETTAMSCADGTAWDTETRTCVPVSTS